MDHFNVEFLNLKFACGGSKIYLLHVCCMRIHPLGINPLGTQSRIHKKLTESIIHPTVAYSQRFFAKSPPNSDQNLIFQTNLCKTKVSMWENFNTKCNKWMCPSFSSHSNPSVFMQSTSFKCKSPIETPCDTSLASPQPRTRINKRARCSALGWLYGSKTHTHGTSGPSFHLWIETQHWDKFNSKAHKRALINTYHIQINRCVDILALCSCINSFIEIKIDCAFG